jgi:hypothetical protein
MGIQEDPLFEPQRPIGEAFAGTAVVLAPTHSPVFCRRKHYFCHSKGLCSFVRKSRQGSFALQRKAVFSRENRLGKTSLFYKITDFCTKKTGRKHCHFFLKIKRLVIVF